MFIEFLGRALGSAGPIHVGRFFMKIGLFRLMLTAWFICLAALAGGPPGDEAAETEKRPADAEKQEATSREEAERLIQERVQVIGSSEKVYRTPGSAHYISKEELEKQDYSDIHRILRQVPGVNIQEEDGYGLRPNIGLRGTGVERSQKITLMEDGVLIAPAPYTAPSAYYFPTAGRMESVEVLKGTSSVKQGPYTNGGSLNMISTSVPGSFRADLNAAGGSHNTKRAHASVGDAYERFGWVAETYQLDTDGFKELDNGGDTGVELKDYMAKLRFESEPGATAYHSVELKLGQTDQFGNETYLGLTEADFNDTPYRRYAASQEDFIDTDHEQYQLRYFFKPNENFDVAATVYRNDYFRNWHKVEKVRGVGAASVLANPGQYETELAILRGDIDSAPGDLTIRNNRRNYYSQGLQATATYQWSTGATAHQLELGARFHEDEEDRFQNEEGFQMLDGVMVLNEIGAPGSQTNRVSSAEARSFFLTDRISLGRWTLTPGVRVESIDYVREDYSTSNPDRSAGPSRVRENSIDAFLPGMGANLQINSQDQAFVGLHKGFSPPGPGSDADTREEESRNFELGYRRIQDGFRFEAIGFFNDYDNLLGTETVVGGGTSAGEVFNGGEVDVWGLEVLAAGELSRRSGLSLPVRLAYTYTDSEFKTSFETGFADWGPAVTAGDELPYLPKHQLSAALGVGVGRWSFDLSGNYVDEMRTNAGQGAVPEGEGTDARLVLDLSAEAILFREYKAFAQVRNLADETYIVSRRPYGVRPGLERTLLFGVSAKF